MKHSSKDYVSFLHTSTTVTYVQELNSIQKKQQPVGILYVRITKKKRFTAIPISFPSLFITPPPPLVAKHHASKLTGKFENAAHNAS
jgi:hypothetical protein